MDCPEKTAIRPLERPDEPLTFAFKKTMKKNNIAMRTGKDRSHRRHRAKVSEDGFKFRSRCVLAFWFAATVCSGFGLHWAGEHSTHEVWHDWAVFHVLSSLGFLITGFRHAFVHRAWYKAWTKGTGRKSLTTLWLSLSFFMEVASGAFLIGCVEGAGSAIGLWHYAAGIVLAGTGLGHIVLRWRMMRHYLRKSKLKNPSLARS